MAKPKQKPAEKSATKGSRAGPLKKPPGGSYSPDIYRSPEIDIASISRGFKRVDVEFHGVDHSGVSYEGRVFLNTPNASARTPKKPEAGYAGSYHIFGHGGCFGDVGHCEIRVRRPNDPRPGHPLTPATKVVTITEPFRKSLAKGAKIVITVVPVIWGGTKKCDYKNVVKFERIKIITYE